MKIKNRIIALAVSLVFLMGCITIPAGVNAAAPQPFFGEFMKETFDIGTTPPADGTAIYGYHGWSGDADNTNAPVRRNLIKSDTDGNKVGSFFLAAASAHTAGKRQFFFNNDIALDSKADYQELSFRLKRVTGNEKALHVYLKGAEGTGNSSNIIVVIDTETGEIFSNKGGADMAASKFTTDKISTVGGWIDFRFVIDKSNWDTYIFINDSLVKKWTTAESGIGGHMYGIYVATYNSRRNAAILCNQDAEFYLDDIYITQYNKDYAGAVVGATPTNGAVGVEPNITSAQVTLKYKMSEAPTVSVTSSETSVLPTAAAVINSADSKKVDITFTGDFDYGKNYSVNITGGKNDLNAAVNGVTTFKTRERQFMVSAPTFTKVTGEVGSEVETSITALETAAVKAKLPIKNEFTENKPVFVVLGSFDSTGKMTDVDYAIEEITAGDTEDISLTVDAAATGELRLYAFDTPEAINPLAGEYSFTSTGLTSLADYAPVSATTITPQVDYDATPVTIKLKGEAPDGTLTALVLKPTKSKADLTIANMASAADIIEFIDQKNASSGAYEFDVPSVTQGMDYVAYVSGVAEPVTFKYYSSNVISALFGAVQSNNKETLANMLSGTATISSTEMPPTVFKMNDVLGLDLTDYNALLDTPAVADAIDGVTYTSVDTLRTAITSKIAERKSYEDTRISLINSVNSAEWDDLETLLKSNDTILTLAWTGDYASLKNTSMLYKKLAEVTFATTGKTTDELIADVRAKFASLATEELDAQNQTAKDNYNNSNTSYRGGGGGGGSITIATPVAVTTPVSTEPSVNNSISFSDLSNVPWAVDAINSLVKRGVLNGVGDNEFAPNDLVTREQFVKMLVLALDIPLNAADASFSDVNSNDWFFPYVNAGYESGIVQGNGGAFGTGRSISRAEMATMCYRALQLLGLGNELSNDVAFADNAQIPEYALDAVGALADAKIINGVGDNLFAPYDSASRAQAAKIIWGIIEWIGGQK